MLDSEDGWQSSSLTWLELQYTEMQTIKWIYSQEDFAAIEAAYKGMHWLAGQDVVEVTPDMLPPHTHPDFKEMTLAARFDCVKAAIFIELKNGMYPKDQTMVNKLVT